MYYRAYSINNRSNQTLYQNITILGFFGFGISETVLVFGLLIENESSSTLPLEIVVATSSSKPGRKRRKWLTVHNRILRVHETERFIELTHFSLNGKSGGR